VSDQTYNAQDFEAFQKVAVEFVGQPRLGEALQSLKNLDADGFKKASEAPYAYLATFDIVVPRDVELQFERTNPTCVQLFFLGYSLRVCVH
jgi:hypothetical protein